MTLADFMHQHPWWTLVYFSVVAIGLCERSSTIAINNEAKVARAPKPRARRPTPRRASAPDAPCEHLWDFYDNCELCDEVKP